MRDLVAELEARDISARIQQARKEAGLTQEQMADLLEVIPRSVQNYESGRVPWNKINAIAKITKKAPEWLLHGESPDPFEGRPASPPSQVEDLLAQVLERLDIMDKRLKLATAERADLRAALEKLEAQRADSANAAT